MPGNWAGESKRDQAVRDYVKAQLLPRDGERGAGQRPVTLLLGPRGSGKTTLLRYLANWAKSGPVVRLDLADLAGQQQRPVEVFASLAFGLNSEKPQVPRMPFPALKVLTAALKAEVDSQNRDLARRQMAQALPARSAGWLSGAYQVAEVAAAMLGLPALVTAALQLLLLGERQWLRRNFRRRVAGLDRTGATSALDFLIELNLAHRGEPEDRGPIEVLACETFLDDLRRSYAKQDWAVRCLMLLDNIDNPLGGEVLALLLQARDPGDPDPLVVLATAGSYPAALQPHRFGSPGTGDGYPGRWGAPGEFEPQQVSDGLRVGQLRDLTRQEVEGQTAVVLGRTGTPAPRKGIPWLGWAVYELTRGQPEGTACVLAELPGIDTTDRWQYRLRQIFESRELVGPLLDRLLPLDCSDELRRILQQAAVAPDLNHALHAGWLNTSELEDAFRDFRQERLHTLHIGTGDRRADGLPPHPLLRRLLLATLREDPATLHSGLRVRAGQRDKPTEAAYHALAGGDLPAAAGYLDSVFERGTPEAWCSRLCRLRRAPVPASVHSAGTAPWSRFEFLVQHLLGDAIDPRLRTITRLLAASWLAPEPPEDPATDGVGDPYRDPLGDPHATLYSEVNARFHTLATAHTGQEAWAALLVKKADQYAEEPWL
ncbi:ATP-binding protein [Streptomyces sp. NBC_01304]|uniref:ATP-binding protein n=1 Tax=Streptomyces sp. NBC_01304 TaxID=2903818 RepID=UPI002E11E606|nr:ATP-binding protein [Streptomyces sp. NBC_01304]